jgi:hypothetical protein
VSSDIGNELPTPLFLRAKDSSARIKRGRARFPQAPRGIRSHDTYVNGPFYVNGVLSDTRNSLRDYQFVFDQYIGKRPKPVRDTYHDLYYIKGVIANLQGYCNLVSDDPAVPQFSQSGVMNAVATYSNVTLRGMPLAEEKALSRLYEAYRGSIDLSIDTYQWKQSVRLIDKIFRVVRYVRTFNVPKLFDSFVNFNFKRGRKAAGGLEYVNKLRGDNWRRIPKEAGGLWLEYSYGLGPLLADVYDTMAEFHHSFEPLLLVKGSGKWLDQFVVSDTTNAFGFERIKYKESVEEINLCKYGVNFGYDPSFSTAISRFSTLNPLGFIWENTPFSFCYDWFVGVGQFLRNFESALLSKKAFKSGYKTKSVFFAAALTTRGYTNYKQPFQPHGLAAEYDASGYKWYKSCERRVLSSPPTPGSPVIKFDFSNLSKALNAASLLATFLKPKH